MLVSDRQKSAYCAAMDKDARRRLTDKLDRPIVLLGMMGAGKSSLGIRLADALGLNFADADNEIEKAAQMSIADIFESHGETAFRDGERRVIKRLLDEAPHILALGGGAFVNDETRALVKDKAVSLFGWTWHWMNWLSGSAANRASGRFWSARMCARKLTS